MKDLSDLLLAVAVVVSVAWCVAAPSYEPVLALVGAVTVLLTRAIAAIQGNETSAFLTKILWPIARWKDRRTPRAELNFDSLSGAQAVHHLVKAWSVWDSKGPSTWMELRHKEGTGSWNTVRRFEGHSVELEARDVDGDGHPELIVRYTCGAHTRVINVFRVDINGFLVPVPGAEVGSDWPEISLEDRDGDGREEIYARQRDWSGVPTQDSLVEVYVYREGGFQKTE